MSKSQAISFFEEISRNQQLSQEVEKVIGEKNSDEAKAKELLSLAKHYGFNFTQEEAASAKGVLKVSLSPEDLLEVSGGEGIKSRVMAMALLVWLGGSVSTLSNIETSAMKPNHQPKSTKEPTNHRRSVIDSALDRKIIEGLNVQNRGKIHSAFSPVTNLDHFQILNGNQEQYGSPFSEPKTKSDSNYEDTSASEVPVEFLQSQIEAMSTTMPGPRLPAGHDRQRAVMKRTSLSEAEVNKLAKKYHCNTRPKFAQSWVNDVVEKMATGLRPDFNATLTMDSHDDFREKCAYCGREGSVNISYEGENGKYHHISCENSGCPMNWVCNDGERIGDKTTPSLAPWKYEVRRWGKLPQLIADIEALLARY